MKKLLLILTLVLVLLVGSVIAARAASPTRIAGSMNYPYYDGWAWATMNVAVDPDTGEASGFIHYKSYPTEKIEEWYGWTGEPVCGSFVEYEGMPAAVLVIKIVEAPDMESGTFLKILVADGGQNASEDLIGLIIFPPQESDPGCGFVEPYYEWFGVNGNITIHQ